jgi:D-arabinose 1-dehydrogenase-like Zn-dependent alcohol dehydrogenase
MHDENYTGGIMPKMRVVQVGRPNGPFEQVEREIPEPGPGHVRIKVHACGICHSDSFTKEGTFPGLQYPRVPGHEIAGLIDAIGPGVAGWKTGQRVGVGWHGGHCGYCNSCRRGDFVTCQIAAQVPGITYSALTGVRPMNEIFPLERAAEAYELMMSGKARFRVVLTTGQ